MPEPVEFSLFSLKHHIDGAPDENAANRDGGSYECV